MILALSYVFGACYGYSHNYHFTTYMELIILAMQSESCICLHIGVQYVGGCLYNFLFIQAYVKVCQRDRQTDRGRKQKRERGREIETERERQTDIERESERVRDKCVWCTFEFYQ